MKIFTSLSLSQLSETKCLSQLQATKSKLLSAEVSLLKSEQSNKEKEEELTRAIGHYTERIQKLCSHLQV